jgi:hypothetical protein
MKTVSKRTGTRIHTGMEVAAAVVSRDMQTLGAFRTGMPIPVQFD